jgi:hypothetical protein
MFKRIAVCLACALLGVVLNYPFSRSLSPAAYSPSPGTTAARPEQDTSKVISNVEHLATGDSGYISPTALRYLDGWFANAGQRWYYVPYETPVYAEQSAAASVKISREQPYGFLFIEASPNEIGTVKAQSFDWWGLAPGPGINDYRSVELRKQG